MDTIISQVLATCTYVSIFDDELFETPTLDSGIAIHIIIIKVILAASTSNRNKRLKDDEKKHYNTCIHAMTHHAGAHGVPTVTTYWPLIIYDMKPKR